MKETSAFTVARDFLSSKTLNVFLLVSGSIYSILLSIWATASPNAAVIRIANSLPMKLWLGVFVVNNLLCLINYFPIAVKACAVDTGKPTVKSLSKKRNHVVVNSNRPAAEIIPVLARRLRLRAYKTKQSRDGLALRAVRWRWASLGTLFFHSAFFFIVLGVVVSPWVRTEATVVVTEGDTFSTKQTERLMEVAPEGTAGKLPDFGFAVETVRPKFWKNKLLFTDMRARIRPTGSNVSKEVLLSSAYKPGPSTYMTLIGLGYAPYFLATDDSGQLNESGYINLQAFPPGAEDSFSLESMPYTVYVKVFPDYAIIKGNIVNRSNNLRHLGYLVRVKMGRQVLTKRLVKPNEKITVGGLHLSFPKMAYWGQFRIVHNPGLLSIWLGFLAGLTGLVWRLVLYRKEVAALVVPGEGQSDVYLHIRSDYFPDRIVFDLQGLAKEIGT